VLSLAYVFDLFTDKLTCLSTRRFAFSLVATRTLNGLFFWHCSASFLVSFYLHEIKTQSRLCVPLAHSEVDSSMRLGKTHTDYAPGTPLARLKFKGRYNQDYE